MRLLTCDSVTDRPIKQGAMLHACAVSGANILRDMRETITNTIGGHMTRYEVILDQTVSRALSTLAQRATDHGYDGVMDVKISHPTITQGAIEVVVAGTGFNYTSNSEA